MIEPLLTPEQVGETLGISARRVKEKIRRHELAGVNIATEHKPGSRRTNPLWRIKPSDLDRFIKENTQSAA